MLIEAAFQFPLLKDRLLECALKAGENTWQQGILKKGNGLCHGISGNAYMFHSIYRCLKKLSE